MINGSTATVCIIDEHGSYPQRLDEIVRSQKDYFNPPKTLNKESVAYIVTSMTGYQSGSYDTLESAQGYRERRLEKGVKTRLIKRTITDEELD